MVWISVLALALSLPALFLLVFNGLVASVLILPFGASRGALVLGVSVHWVQRYVKSMAEALLGEHNEKA